ncbi:uncharacterized protein LOC120069439 isoform X2 [Benincasa hispida]|uniref:uncharacterized protein LOC120069439 isoform X2 n=1 Tax=Benincasa hispida TaxID=102211 RepID=UPI0019029AF2|nr:uncharacterized protein LOC120069439 isoform X2 [Benincasa hispida]
MVTVLLTRLPSSPSNLMPSLFRLNALCSYNMDVDKLYLDLLALRELYILLLKSCLGDANSELDLATNSNIFDNFLHKDDKQVKPLADKVPEWMKHNQTRRKMGNPEIRDRASASNVAINNLSHSISSALRRIELHILSLQHCTSQRRKTRCHWQSVLQWNESLNQQNVHPRTGPSTLRSRFTKPIKGRGHFVGEQKKVKPKTANHCSEYVHGFRIPLSQTNDEAMKPLTIETHITKQHKVVNPMTLIDKSGYTSVGSKATFRPAMKLNQTSKQQAKRNQNSYGQMVMGPTLLDHHPSKETRNERINSKTHLAATQQESEFTSSEFQSASSSSSSWTTQETSVSETVANDGDSNPSSPSHQDDPLSTDSKSSSLTKTFYIKQGKTESKKVLGRFKRLKNKLGVVFHHHHHHHHHHHNSNNFMWKQQLRKIFHSRDNKRLLVSKEDGNEKVKKRAIRNVCYKNQVGKFQALAEGLRSHVWRSKAMKRKGVKGMKCGKKGVKKLHWWKMFRNRRGVRLPNKGHMKIGYVNKKAKL